MDGSLILVVIAPAAETDGFVVPALAAKGR